MTRIETEKAIKALELELREEADKDRRDELRDRLAYMRDKALSVAAQEYREDVKDDYRFRQW